MFFWLKLTLQLRRQKRVSRMFFRRPSSRYFEFEHRGERRRPAVYSDANAAGGNLAIVMVDATDPREDVYLEKYGVLTVNLPADPAAAKWCACPGHVVLDTNNNPACLVGALEEQGVLRAAPASVRSGFCCYPLARLSAAAMDALEDAEGTARSPLSEAGQLPAR